MYTNDIDNVLNKCWKTTNLNNSFKEVQNNPSSYALDKFKNMFNSHKYKRKMKQPESRFYKKQIQSTKLSSLSDFLNDENNDQNFIKWKQLDYFFKKKYLLKFCEKQKNKLDDSEFEKMEKKILEDLENGKLLKKGALIYNFRKKEIIRIF